MANPNPQMILVIREEPIASWDPSYGSTTFAKEPKRVGSKPCPDCKGLGYRDPRHPEDACSTCGGDGRVPA